MVILKMQELWPEEGSTIWFKKIGPPEAPIAIYLCSTEKQLDNFLADMIKSAKNIKNIMIKEMGLKRLKDSL